MKINKSDGEISSDRLPRQLSMEQQEEDEQTGVLNVSGILSGPQFLLIVLLVVSCMALVQVENGQLHLHEKWLRMYFNKYLLDLPSQSIYQNSDNPDEQYNQFFTFQDMCQLVSGVINATNSYMEDGTVLFELDQQQPVIIIEPVYTNNTFDSLEFYTVEEAINFLGDFDGDVARDFFLAVESFIIRSRLGSSKFADNYEIEASFTMHHSLMMDGDFSYQYEEISDKIQTKLRGLRVLAQIIAALLLLLFIFRLLDVWNQIKKEPDIVKKIVLIKHRNWYVFLCLMNMVTIWSPIYSAMSCWLQLLPIFEFPEQTQDREMYNFNKNIRFSLPLILKIWLPLLLFLHGFIYLSMLLYADTDDAYFGDYYSTFFDYMYQMFQVGTYEIFTQMQIYGYFYDMLYSFLYFYVFMMGSTLVPAFFVTLIQLKLNQRDVKRFTAHLLKTAVCPECNTQNHLEIDQRTLNIVINSPKLSPLVRQRRLLHSPKGSVNSLKRKASSKVSKPSSQISLFIQNSKESQSQLKNKYKMNQKFVSYSSKVSRLFRDMALQVGLEKDVAALEKTLAAVHNYRLPFTRPVRPV